MNQPEQKRRRSIKPSLKGPDVTEPSSSKIIGPSEKDFHENLEQDILFVEVEENTFLRSLLRQSCSYVQRFRNWTGFNVTINSDTSVLKSTVSYLDCIEITLQSYQIKKYRFVQYIL